MKKKTYLVIVVVSGEVGLVDDRCRRRSGRRRRCWTCSRFRCYINNVSIIKKIKKNKKKKHTRGSRRVSRAPVSSWGTTVVVTRVLTRRCGIRRVEVVVTC